MGYFHSGNLRNLYPYDPFYVDHPSVDFTHRFYLPNSSAGAPSISPSFNSWWTNTSNGARVVSRPNRKYGTSNDDVVIVTNSIASLFLIRQYVGSFIGTGMQNTTGGGVAPGVAFEAKGSRADGFFMVVGWLRLIDTAGTNLFPAPTLGPVTIPANGSKTMSSSGLFSPSMVGRFFTIPGTDNRCRFGVLSQLDRRNAVTSYTSSNSVELANTYDVGSNSIGSGKTIRWIFENDYEGFAEAAPTGGLAFTSFQPFFMQFPAVATKFLERHLYVLELGFWVDDSRSTTYTFRFGDATDMICFDPVTNGSSAGFYTGYPKFPALIS